MRNDDPTPARPARRLVLAWPLAAWLATAAPAARADAVDQLRAFVRDVKSGRATFTQTVISPDGARRRTSSGEFEFQRPNRFRFAYAKPFEQLIVADGQKVWIHDPELNQVSSRRLADALGSTPAALLAGGSLEPEFALAAQPSEGGLDWVQATPRARDGSIQSLRVGFRGGVLAKLEILDAFGQRSLLEFAGFVPNATLAAERFRFVPPAGADLVEQ